jgi:hypothetical protein
VRRRRCDDRRGETDVSVVTSGVLSGTEPPWRKLLRKKRHSHQLLARIGDAVAKPAVSAVELQTLVPGHHDGDVREREGRLEDFEPERSRFPEPVARRGTTPRRFDLATIAGIVK